MQIQLLPFLPALNSREEKKNVMQSILASHFYKKKEKPVLEAAKNVPLLELDEGYVRLRACMLHQFIDEVIIFFSGSKGIASQSGSHISLDIKFCFE